MVGVRPGLTVDAVGPSDEEEEGLRRLLAQAHHVLFRRRTGGGVCVPVVEELCQCRRVLLDRRLQRTGCFQAAANAARPRLAQQSRRIDGVQNHLQIRRAISCAVGGGQVLAQRRGWLCCGHCMPRLRWLSFPGVRRVLPAAEEQAHALIGAVRVTCVQDNRVAAATNHESGITSARAPSRRCRPSAPNSCCLIDSGTAKLRV